MSVYKVKISTSIADATSGDGAALVPKSSSYPTNAIALTDANNDGWWLSADQSSSNTIGDYDLWVDTGSGYGKVTQTEGLNSWYGNNSIKTHIDAANPHSGSASSSDLTSHIDAANPHSGSASSSDLTSHIESVSNPHNVTVSQIESESGVALARIDDTAGDGDTTVTWSADKLYDRIGVALEDGNIISANNSHAVAITALDAAIENISATGNTTGTSLSNTIYANSREQIVSGGGNDYYSFAGSSDFLPFKKDSNATKIRVSFEGKIEGITGSAPGNISLEGGKLNAAGTGLTTDSVISSFKYLTSMSYTSYELEDNISNFSSGINVIKIKLNPDSTYDLYIRNVVVDVV